MNNVYKLCLNEECSRSLAVTRRDIERYFHNLSWI